MRPSETLRCAEIMPNRAEPCCATLQVVADLVEIVAPEAATWLGVATSAMSRMGVASSTCIESGVATWHATEPEAASTLPIFERVPAVVLNAEAMRAAALPIIERAPAAALLIAIPWHWPRDIRLLQSQFEPIVLDLDIGLEVNIDVLHPLGFGSMHAFAAHLCSLAPELEVLGRIASRLCRLAMMLLVVFSEP